MCECELIDSACQWREVFSELCCILSLFSREKDIRFLLTYSARELGNLDLTIIGSNLHCGSDNLYLFSRRKETGLKCESNSNALHAECNLRNVTTRETKEYCRYNCPCFNIVPCRIDIMFYVGKSAGLCEVLIH